MEFKLPEKPGGLFHTPKVKYSPETAAFLKELIRESKLSIFQRKQLNESIKAGDPLPLPPTKTNRRKQPEPEEENIKKILIPIPRRRKHDAISKSGAYERDKFFPSRTEPNNDVEKRKLQDVMAFGKVITQKKTKQELLQQINEKENRKGKEPEINRDKLFLKTLEEIKERHEFLRKMQEMGKGKEYKEIIEQQIWEKLRFLEAIDKDLFTTMQKYIKHTSQISTLNN